jgi:response regulator of citrate/malate metabolism
MNVIAFAATAAEAKQVLIDWQGLWQLIIVDLFLDSGSGLDGFAAVQSRTSGQYASVLSNYATAEM